MYFCNRQCRNAAMIINFNSGSPNWLLFCPSTCIRNNIMNAHTQLVSSVYLKKRCYFPDLNFNPITSCETSCKFINLRVLKYEIGIMVMPTSQSCCEI